MKSGYQPDQHGNLLNNSPVLPDHNRACSSQLDVHGAETGVHSGAKMMLGEGSLFAESQIPESFSQVSQPDPYVNMLLSKLLSQESEPEYLTQFSELESSFLPDSRPDSNALVSVGPGYEGSHAVSLEEKRQQLEDDFTLCKRYHGKGWRCASIALEGRPYCEKHYNDTKKREPKTKKTSYSVKSTERREQSPSKRKWSSGDNCYNEESEDKSKSNSNPDKLPRVSLSDRRSVPPKQSSSWYDNVVHGPPRFSQLLTQASQSKPSQPPKATKTFDHGIRKYFTSEVPLDPGKSSETATTGNDDNKGTAILLVGETNLREQILEHMLASKETRPSPNLPKSSKVLPDYKMTFRCPSINYPKNDVKTMSGECRLPNFVESAMSKSFLQASRPDQHANLLSNPQIFPDRHMEFSSPDIRHERIGVESNSKTNSGNRPDQHGNLSNNSQALRDQDIAFSSQDVHRAERSVGSGAKPKSGEFEQLPIFEESQIPESFSQVSQPDLNLEMLQLNSQEEPDYLTQFSEPKSSFLPTVNALLAVGSYNLGSNGVSLEEKPQQLEGGSTLCKWSHTKGWLCASVALEGRPYCEKHLHDKKKRGSKPEAKASREDTVMRLDSEEESVVNLDSPCPLWSENPSLQAFQTKFSPTNSKKHPQSRNPGRSNMAFSSQDVHCAETGVESSAKTKSGEGRLPTGEPGLPIFAESQIPECFSQVSRSDQSLDHMLQLSQEEPKCFTQFSELESSFLPTAHARVPVGRLKGSHAVSLLGKPQQLEDDSTLCKCHWRRANCMVLEGQPFCERHCNDLKNYGGTKPNKTSDGTVNLSTEANEQWQKQKWSDGGGSDNKDSKEKPKSNSNSDFVAEVKKVWDELQELSVSDNLESEILGKLLEQSAGLRLSQCRSVAIIMNKMETSTPPEEPPVEVPIILGNENDKMET